MAQQYPNRSDLRNPAQKIAKQAATGQTYGVAGQQMAAQQAVPMGQSPASAAPAPRPRPAPGSLGALDRPTERPNDMLMPMPDAGPGMFTPADPVIEELSLLYAQFPNDDLANLISALRFGD
jgi:hypothetical protein